MKWTRIATLAAITVAATMTFALTGCGGNDTDTNSGLDTVSTVSTLEVKEPIQIPFTLPSGFTYNKEYSTADVALYNNTDGIAITYKKEDSSTSILLSAQNNTATQDTTYTVIAAKRPDITDLTVSDFSYNIGQGYASCKYLISFTNRSVEEVNYVYTYTDDKNIHTISVNAPKDKTDSASQIADSVRDSFDPKDSEDSAILPATATTSSDTASNAE